MTAGSRVTGPWTAARDEAFFRIVQATFPPAFLRAASELLASYDDLAELAEAAAGPARTAAGPARG